jgi:hypothetical protein
VALTALTVGLELAVAGFVGLGLGLGLVLGAAIVKWLRRAGH